MTSEDTIRYRPDGSIDTDHYLRIGRRLRSEHALGLLAGGRRQNGRARRHPVRIFGLI